MNNTHALVLAIPRRDAHRRWAKRWITQAPLVVSLDWMSMWTALTTKINAIGYRRRMGMIS